MKSWVLAIALLGCGSAAAALPVQQQQPQQPLPVEISFSAGRVSLLASDAPVGDLLAAWAREGHAELAGAEYLGTRRITLRLTNAAEADALRAIVGSAGWYFTVGRDAPAASESAFQRIVIRPEAATSASASRNVDPERRYSYYSDPEADAAAMAMVAQAAAAPKPTNLRPPDVEPESFYQYEPAVPADAPDPMGILPPPGFTTRQPLRLSLGVDPEVLYTYTGAPPEPAEPVVSSSIIPPTPALDPEVRYTYDSLPTELPANMVPKPQGDSGLPDIRVFEGLDNLPRLPGRVIRYVTGG